MHTSCKLNVVGCVDKAITDYPDEDGFQQFKVLMNMKFNEAAEFTPNCALYRIKPHAPPRVHSPSLIVQGLSGRWILFRYPCVEGDTVALNY